MKQEKEGIVWTMDDDGRLRCTLVINETAAVIAEVLAVFAMMIALVRQTIRRRK